MADEWLDSRTEQPTERRRQRAREEGLVAVSHELTTAVVLLAGILALVYGAGNIGFALFQTFLQVAENCQQCSGHPEALANICAGSTWPVLQRIALFLVITTLAGLTTHLAQTGMLLVPGLINWNVERISPAAGLGRLFSWASVWRTSLACGKVILLAAVGWWLLSGRKEQITSWCEIPLTVTIGEIWALALRLALYGGLCLLVLALGDYAWQRWRYERQLMMTRWELKEELRQDEGDPLLRARLRKLMREMSQRRMFQEVPQATVVLRNPTHVAVALRYDRHTMSAPCVVAKGAGVVAQRIIEIARQHGVPILEKPPLAQALFRMVQVGQEIPPALYLAVAEVLAFIYRQRGWSTVAT